MLTEEFKTALNVAFPSIVVDEKGQYLTLHTDEHLAHDLLSYLKKIADPNFEKLACLSGVDWLTHMEVVYHLDSLKINDTLVVKSKIIDRVNPITESITDLWKGADLLECEVYDLLGIKFTNHPHLRRLFLNEEWEGYPLRKDYVDEINMITL